MEGSNKNPQKMDIEEDNNNNYNNKNNNPNLQQPNNSNYTIDQKILQMIE